MGRTVEALAQVMTSKGIQENFGSQFLGADDAFEVLEEADETLAHAEQEELKTDKITKAVFFFSKNTVAGANASQQQIRLSCQFDVSAQYPKYLKFYQFCVHIYISSKEQM